MMSPTPRPCSRGSSSVPLWSLIKPTTRTEFAPISGPKAPLPTSPTAPIGLGSPGGKRLCIASATISNASLTSSSSTAGSLPATISLALASLPSSNSQPCGFGFEQLSPRPSVPLIPKFASEVAARVCELRNRDTSLLVEHDLLRKPVSTFRDHALGRRGETRELRVGRLLPLEQIGLIGHVIILEVQAQLVQLSLL